MVDIIQPLLEPILFQKAAEKGATFAFNTEYIRHEQVTLGLAHDRDIAWARAEALRFRVQLELGRGTDP